MSLTIDLGKSNSNKKFADLSFIYQAYFVLQAYSDGHSQQQIVIDVCDGDEQAVAIWTRFCKAIGWIERNGKPDNYDVTKEGMAVLELRAKNIAQNENKNESRAD